MPWKGSKTLHKFFTEIPEDTRFYVSGTQDSPAIWSGDEGFWAAYIQENINVYTVVFGQIIEMLNVHLFLNPDDTALLTKITKVFKCEPNGDMFNGLMNVNNLATTQSNAGMESSDHLDVFNLPNINTAVNHLIQKVGQKSGNGKQMSKNWGSLFKISQSADPIAAHSRRVSINPWIAPLKPGECEPLYFMAYQAAKFIDKVVNKSTIEPPSVNLRGAANYINVIWTMGFFLLAYYILLKI